MFVRWRLIVLLAAGAAATGLHWDIVQVYAWTRMYAEFSRTDTGLVALRRTFEPQGMCDLCHLVQDAKHEMEEVASPNTLAEGKAPLLWPAPGNLIVRPPAAVPLMVAVDRLPGSLNREPLLPPPRSRA